MARERSGAGGGRGGIDPETPDLSSAKAAFVGEGTENLLKAPLTLLVLWLLAPLPWFPNLGVKDLFLTVVIGTAVLATVGFAAARFFEVRAGRSAPGGLE